MNNRKKSPKKSEKKSDVGLVRIEKDDKRFLEKVAQEDFGGESMSKVVHRMIDEYRRKRYFAALNESYAALKADPVAWDQEQQIRKVFGNADPSWEKEQQERQSGN